MWGSGVQILPGALPFLFQTVLSIVTDPPSRGNVFIVQNREAPMLNATAQSGAPSADLPTWAIALMQSIGSLKSYLYSLPHLILAGDYSATILGLILLYFLLITIQKLSSFFLVTLQRSEEHTSELQSH